MSKSPKVPGITPTRLPIQNNSVSAVVRASISENKAVNTPPSSPPQFEAHTPVIVANPSVQFSTPLIPIPELPPDPISRLPDPSGRWDNLTNTPSYFKGSATFWASRNSNIPIVSTVSSPYLSEAEFSPNSGSSLEVFDEKLVGQDLNSQIGLLNSMTPSNDPLLAAELDRLADIKDEVELSLESDIEVSRVTACNANVVKELMNDVHTKAKRYALDMTKLSRKFPSADKDLLSQYNTDGKALLVKVNKHIDLLLIKMHEAQPQPQVNRVNPRLGGSQPNNLQEAVATIIAKAEVKYTTLLNLALTTKQDAEEDGLYLDTASDDKISQLVHKIAKFEKVKDKITASHNEYLEFTAVNKPDAEQFPENKLSSAVNEAVSEITTLIKTLEVEDEDRGLSTLLPRKTEKMKWPTFSGKQGENYFKFKEKFFKVAKQNMVSRADQLSKLREN